MKIAIPIDGKNLESNINRSFGRTKQFIVVDSKTLDFNLVDNSQNLQAAQGAGIQAAQAVVNANSEAIITMNCGPKAFRVLNSAGIKVYLGKSGSIKENIDALNNNDLEEMKSSNVEGHWM